MESFITSGRDRVKVTFAHLWKYSMYYQRYVYARIEKACGLYIKCLFENDGRTS